MRGDIWAPIKERLVDDALILIAIIEESIISALEARSEREISAQMPVDAKQGLDHTLSPPQPSSSIAGHTEALPIDVEKEVQVAKELLAECARRNGQF